MKIIYDTGYRDQIRFLNTASTLEKKQSLEYKLITDKGYLSYVWNKIFPIPIPIICRNTIISWNLLSNMSHPHKS